MTSALATLLFWETLFDAQAAALLGKLGDERFFVREAASAALVRLVRSDDGRAVLARVQGATHHPDPEVSRRAECVVAEFYNVRPSKAAQVPWIDMLPPTVKDRGVLISEYCRRSQEAGCPSNAPRWTNYRYATSLYVGDLLRSGQPRARVQLLLDEMAEVEQKYRAKEKLKDE